MVDITATNQHPSIMPDTDDMYMGEVTLKQIVRNQACELTRLENVFVQKCKSFQASFSLSIKTKQLVVLCMHHSMIGDCAFAVAIPCVEQSV